MSMRRLPLLLLPCLLVTSAAAQGAIDFTRLRPAKDSFVVMLQGKPIGFEVITLERTDTGFLVVDHTNLMPRMQQTTEIVIAADGAMTSVKQRGELSGLEMKIDVAYGGGKAKGSATTPGEDGNLETKDVAADVPPHVVDDNVLLPLLPGVAWRPGIAVTVPVFASGKSEVLDVTLRVVGTERLQVPAGTFDAFKVMVEGMKSPMTLYISTGLPNRVLKAAPQGAPIEFVAAR
jgi:hypothetical protein